MKFNTKILIFLISSILFPSSVLAKTTIVFRIDDFLFRDNSKQEQIVNLFEKYCIPLSVAWIPIEWETETIDCMSDSLWEIYSERFNSGMIDIMQHGCYHHNFKADCNPYMEFQNLTESEQSTLVDRGKAILDSCLHAHGVKTEAMPIGFVFPCNVYDKTSLHILKDNDFSILSSNLVASLSKELTSYPCTTENFEEIESHLDKLADGVIILLFHNYTINEDYTFDQLDALLKRISNDKNIECITLRELYRRGQASYNGAFIAKHPLCLRLFGAKKLYFNNVNNLFASAVHGFLYAIVFWITFVISGLLLRMPKTIKYATTFCTIPFLIFGGLSYAYVQIHMTIWLVIVVTVAICIAASSRFRSPWRK